MALLKAIAAQLCAGLATILIVRGGLIGTAELGAAALLQGLLAAACAAALRSERWWLAIHLLFAPLVLVAARLQIPSGWYLAALLLSVLVYWSSFRTRVPLYLSNRATVRTLSELIDRHPAGHLLDIGSGTGSVVRALARRHADWRLLGIEAAPLPHAIAALLGRAQPNLELQRGDFFDADWSRFDIVYAFLSPVPMPRVWAKATAQMRPGALLVSNSFAIPGVEAERVIEVGDRRGTRLLCYRPAPRKRR